MANLRDIIRELIKDNEEIYSAICKVDKVDRDKRLCDVSPVDDSAKIFNVRLQAKVSSEIGLVLFPKEGSEVTVTFITKDLAFVSSTSEIEDIELSIGDFSLTIDSENFNKSVKNININTEDYVLEGSSVDFKVSEIFNVVSDADIKLKALSLALEASTIDLTGATTVNGTMNINGVTTINGAASVSGAMVMAGAVTMGGGSNGGVPKGSALSSELNKLVTEINKIITAFSGWTPSANDGGAALKARVSGLSSLSNVDTSSITNPNVKH